MKKLATILGLLAVLVSAPAYAQIGGAANIGGAITDDSGPRCPA